MPAVNPQAILQTSDIFIISPLYLTNKPGPKKKKKEKEIGRLRCVYVYSEIMHWVINQIKIGLQLYPRRYN